MTRHEPEVVLAVGRVLVGCGVCCQFCPPALGNSQEALHLAQTARAEMASDGPMTRFRWPK
jgi:hypothetical protein